MANNHFISALKSRIDKVDIRNSKDLISSLLNDYSILETVFNSMLEGVIVLDREMVVIACNRNGLKFLNISRKVQIGKKLSDIINDNKLLEILTNAVNREEKIFDYHVKINRDDIEHISLNIQPLVNDGKIIGSILIINDITDSKRNEARLRNAEGLAALTTISAGIAHEIKNPLGAMSIHVQLIDQVIQSCKCRSADDLKYSIGVLHDEIERLNGIVMNFLVTVRPLKAEFMPVNINQFIRRLIDFIKPELDNNGISIFYYDSGEYDLWLDDKYFRQAFLNLIQNAIYALKDIDKPRIIIRTYKKGTYLNIEVEDNGCGIPDDLQGKIFDPYFTTKDFGTGLGLTIVYKIIKEHSGDIICKSAQGKTVFIIRMPLPFLEKELLEYSG